MNERIIETPLGNLLLFRDVDEDQQCVLVLQHYIDDGTIVKTSISFSCPDKVRQAIKGYTPAQAAKHIDSYPF